MGYTEIERKFLVERWFDPSAFDFPHVHMIQGYLSSDLDRTVRIRTAGDRAYLTVKGRTHGCSRFEWEMEIPYGDAQRLLTLCLPVLIEKERYIVGFGTHSFEVDVFGGALDGLVTAEVELSGEDESFEPPPWLGAELTSDARFSNSSLAACGGDLSFLDDYRQTERF